MTTKFIKSVLLIVITITLLSFDIPNGWIKKGDSPAKYEMGIEKGAGQNGKNAGTIKSIDKTIDGFGTLMQNIKPDRFFGKKIKLTGFIKCKDVDYFAGLWLRVDLPEKSILDNMSDRFLKGNHDWTKCELVLEISKDAKNIAFGALISGTGQIWFDNFKIEVVDDSEKVKGELQEEAYHWTSLPVVNSEPINLDFSK